MLKQDYHPKSFCVCHLCKEVIRKTTVIIHGEISDLNMLFTEKEYRKVKISRADF